MSGSTDYLASAPFTPDQSKALSMNAPLVSDVYKDQFGVHRTVYAHVEGTDSIIGIIQDAKFISDLKRNVLIISIALSLGGLLIGSVVSYVLSTRLVNSIKKLVDYTEVVAQGDLTKTISLNNQDEIGHLAYSFQNMQQELKNTIEHVHIATDNLVSSSEDINAEFRTNDECSQSYDSYNARSICN